MVVALAAVPSSCARAPSRPCGVILISVDALRADRLNCYGYTARTVSRNVDALARDGVLFEAHIAASPWTTPSHMSMFTSLHPTAHGVIDSYHLEELVQKGRGYPRLSEKTHTLSELLQQAGWATGAFTGGGTVDGRIGFGRGFDSLDQSMVKLSPKKTRRMIDWLAERRRRRFFLFWHTFEVHAPYLRTTFLDEVTDSERAAAVRKSFQAILRQPGAKDKEATEDSLKRLGAFTPEINAALYDGGIAYFDERLGELVAWLKKARLYDRLLILLTSDHGEQLGERGLGFYDIHGHTLYEEIIRTPLIVKLPGQRCAGMRVTGVTRAIDLLPTILDIGGVDAGAATPQLTGVSLRAFWERPAEAPELEAISEATNTFRECKGLRTKRYKLILNVDPEPGERFANRLVVPEQPSGREFYDLRSDPGEERNVLRSNDHALPAQAARAEARLRQVLSHPAAETGAANLDQEAIDRIRALGYLD
jgi:arylsulfatase